MNGFLHRQNILLEGYDYPVFPEDFAYYLLKDNNTLVMISAIKNIKKNFKFDIANKKLNHIHQMVSLIL